MSRKVRRMFIVSAVRQALASALPPSRKEYVARSRPAIDPWSSVIDAWLIADQDVLESSGTRPGGCGSGWWPSTAPSCRR